MSDFESVDFFTDPSLIPDPYPYFDDLRSRCPVMSLPGASNRDERNFAGPSEFRIVRPNVREHVAFGRGNRSCPGAPLARAEGRISLNRILDRMSDITIAEAEHGPPDARRYTYEPTWQMRGLTELHLGFTPIA